MSSDYRTGREGKEFAYRGHSLDELQEMDVDEVAELLPARQRRSIVRGLGTEQQKLLEKVRSRDKETTADNPIRTHLRDMPILPEFVGVTFSVYNGHSFERVQVEPEMIGHFLGEFPPHTKHRRTRSGRHRRDPVLEVRAPQVTPMGINYSVEADPETTAKGMLRDRPISVKDSKEISREIKGDGRSPTPRVPPRSHRRGDLGADAPAQRGRGPPLRHRRAGTRGYYPRRPPRTS